MAMPSQTRSRSSNCYEILLGRSLAACVHPFAAWQSTVRSFRVLLVAGYFAVGYVAALAAMFLLK
jgi:hypothetical protein